MNCALISLEMYGREFEPKLDNLSLLRNIVGEEFLKGHFKDKYEEVIKQLDQLTNYISNMVAYYSDIDKKIIHREDITSRRFLEYWKGVSYAVKHMFFIDKLLLLMVNETDLRDKTIPSTYWNALALKEKHELPQELLEQGRPTVYGGGVVTTDEDRGDDEDAQE